MQLFGKDVFAFFHRERGVLVFLEFATLAALCAPQVHPTTLSSIVMQESRGSVYAIGVNGGSSLPHQPRTLAEAVQTAEWLHTEGIDFDAGLGQINRRNFARLGLSIPDLFNPCKNIRAAATVLTECYTRSAERFGEGQAALRAALSVTIPVTSDAALRTGMSRKCLPRSTSLCLPCSRQPAFRPCRPTSHLLSDRQQSTPQSAPPKMNCMMPFRRRREMRLRETSRSFPPIKSVKRRNFNRSNFYS